MLTKVNTDTIQVNLSDVLQHLQIYLERVERGETIVILEDGRPVAEIRPPASLRQRPFGLCAGEFRVPDDFDAPLPEHLLREFESR